MLAVVYRQKIIYQMAVCQANFTFVTLKLQKNKWIDCEYVENFYFFRANFRVIKYSCRYVYSQLR
jgi:hypothetical protein